MRTKSLILTGCMALAWCGASAQYLQEGQVAWGPASEKFGTTLQNWTPGGQVSADDNFFISRVKPKARFRNAATQVMDTLQTTYDKKLIAWLPVNNMTETGWNRNALPDGRFDSEVFSMWSYVTHWGNWSAPMGRVPAALLDVAHKNGVGVSGCASVPNASISSDWESCFRNMINCGDEKTAQYMSYYGLDGIGYNSEYSESSGLNRDLAAFHGKLVKRMRETNPLFENFWYTGSTDDGYINFSGMLSANNRTIFGNGDAPATSLFLNYNWNESRWITQSQTQARTLNRDPLDLYAGFNMQGAQPTSWELLSQTRYSIGLWGAHSSNMFFETRHEQGSAPATKQKTYLKRIERWFTGGTRNPLNCPPYVASDNYNANNYAFHGMAKMMSARSSLCWNLSEEPFITYFNLGNGQFFNWQGQQQNDRPWYNVGVQDYLPTWRYWFANTLLAHDPAAVPASGLDADFTWDEAYVGGSTLHIFGTTPEEYLHLFKTQFALQEGDKITLRYKLTKGAGQANLVLTAEGAETVAINEADFNVLSADQETDEEVWVTREFTVGDGLAGKTLALVALHFQNAADLDLVLGEFSIVRGDSPVPATPVVTSAVVLANHANGVDGKLIFNMPNTKAAGEPCYNLDVNTAFFKLYAQQEGQEPVLMGITTSWAGLVFSAPMSLAEGASSNVRFGVAAVSLDHKSQSETAWSDYLPAGNYTYSDDIETDKAYLSPDDPFVISYTDPRHEAGLWTLINEETGETAATGLGTSIAVDPLPSGTYKLVLTGAVHSGGTTTSESREFPNYITVTDARFGRLPIIESLTANGEESDIEVVENAPVALAYTGRVADGARSQGINLQEKNFGVNAGDAGLDGNKSYSLAFWMKINSVNGYTQLISVVNTATTWPQNNWGAVWTGFGEDGSVDFTYRNDGRALNPPASKYSYGAGTIPVGRWFHCAIVVDILNGALKASLYINGVKQTPSDINIDGASNQADTYYSHTGYPVQAADMISVGGNAAGRNAIDGTIDNFQLWKKAMTEEEVQLSMGDLDPASLPAGLSYFWDFENMADSGYGFTSKGDGGSLVAGTYELEKIEGEGAANILYIEPQYTAGAPAITISSNPIITLPSWKSNKGIFSNETGNDQAGSATVTYKHEGDYRVTLTLENSLGSDSRTFSVIRVTTEETGINGVGAGALRTYTVGDVAYVEFAEAGNYDVRVYDLAGRAVASKAAYVGANGKMRLHLGPVGTYVVSIKKDGRELRGVKLLRK